MATASVGYFERDQIEEARTLAAGNVSGEPCAPAIRWG